MMLDWEYPVLTKYEGEHTKQIAFPLGGIGTGSVCLGGRGQLRDWEIMNKPSKGFNPLAFFTMWAKSGNVPPVTRVLEGAIQPPYEGATGCTENVAGLPRFRDFSFEAAYPLAQVHLSDPSVPVKITIKAFNPLIPLDAENSGLPIAAFRFLVKNPTQEKIELSIAYSMENFVGFDGIEGRAEGSVIEPRSGDGFEGLLFSSNSVNPDSPQWGTIAVAFVDSNTTYRHWTKNRTWQSDLLSFWDDFSEDGRFDPITEEGSARASISASRTIPAGETEAIDFVLAWYFPNRTARGCGWGVVAGEEIGYVGNYYTTKFDDAWDVIVKSIGSLPKLEYQSIEFARTICESTLPQSVKEAALNNLSTLRTQTCFRTEDGRFFGFEGCSTKRGCCFGSCTHVWNYEQATGFLFPELARTMRDVEFGHSTTDSGAMAFRTPLPLRQLDDPVSTAADGQMGCIMKIYRDWQISGDDEFLKSYWTKVKKALSFAWAENSWDANRNGVMEGKQHNTYDVEFYGPNPMMQAWYLGALRAGEEMARYLGDSDFADRCKELFVAGSRWTDEHLFNGEYYEQIIDPEHPDYQFGKGCLVDQLVGQYMAHVIGIGYLLNKENVRKTLDSLYRYNFKRELHDHWNVMRTYALNDESAMLICSYPKGERPKRPFPYFSEVMTGFEYQAAVHMLYEGMLDEGLAVISAIRARYDGRKRNPWDEAECGHHYARAMASWAAILALSGFRSSGVERSIRFDPKLRQDSFATFWSAGTAWGRYRQCRTETSFDAEIIVSWGSVNIRSIKLPWHGKGREPKRIEITVGEKAVDAQTMLQDENIAIMFSSDLHFEPGKPIMISCDL